MKVTLGKTGLVVPKNGFGALPIQRIAKADAVYLIQKALEHGMYYFDTARFYTDSEEKLGEALHDRRDKVIISSKTGASTVEQFWQDLETSLRLLRTDYIDIYQFHNPAQCPKPGDGTGLYEAMQEAVMAGKVRHVGISNHRLAVAQEAIDSGLYETLQFPFSYLAGEPELHLVQQCREHNIGYIAMKGLAGGLITHAATAFAYMAQFPGVVPIWRIQKECELDERLAFQESTPELTDEMQERIRHDREQLSGAFCRGCGYCQPCPAGIQIEDCNRMYLFLRRAPYGTYLNETFYEKMQKIKDCKHCNQCSKRCPYGLDTPALLAKNYEDFMEHWARRDEIFAIIKK